MGWGEIFCKANSTGGKQGEKHCERKGETPQCLFLNSPRNYVDFELLKNQTNVGDLNSRSPKSHLIWHLVCCLLQHSKENQSKCKMHMFKHGGGGGLAVDIQVKSGAVIHPLSTRVSNSMHSLQILWRSAWWLCITLLYKT